MPVYVRVRDLHTRHEYDVREDSPLLRKGLVQRVKADRYPPSATARRPKHFLKLAGRTASRETAPPSGGADEATITQEN